jgi:hypothetical protein
MKPQPLDRLTVDSKDYIYRDGNWTTPTGYTVPTAHGQLLTMTFFERFGRTPCMPEVAPAPGKATKIRSVVAKPSTPKAPARKVSGARRAPAAGASMR